MVSPKIGVSECVAAPRFIQAQKNKDPETRLRIRVQFVWQDQD